MEGLPPSVIARRLRRTESAIRNKAGMQGISLAFRADDLSDASETLHRCKSSDAA